LCVLAFVPCLLVQVRSGERVPASRRAIEPGGRARVASVGSRCGRGAALLLAERWAERAGRDVIRASTRDLSRSCVQVGAPSRRETPAAAASCPATGPTRRPPHADARVQGPGRQHTPVPEPNRWSLQVSVAPCSCGPERNTGGAPRARRRLANRRTPGERVCPERAKLSDGPPAGSGLSPVGFP
jgi:hypothetical protein